MSIDFTDIDAPVSGAGPMEITAAQLEELTGMHADTSIEAPTPSMAPPGSGEASAALAERVLVLYNEASNRNQWLYFQTTGWVKVGQATDSGSMALAALGGLARTLGVPAYADTGSSGQVETLYLW